MAHILTNKEIEVHVDLPFEKYSFSRFDWTGKIAKVIFRGIPVSGKERAGGADEHLHGKGFCNEFGIGSALGFEEAEAGGWFHKIGVGLLRKEGGRYQFSTPYRVKPGEFSTEAGPSRIIITCRSEQVNGYAYLLIKETELTDQGFTIRYRLDNTGDKPIVSDEYNHNFVAIDNDAIGKDYLLTFPFQLRPGHFGEIVNPGGAVKIGKREMTFKRTPAGEYFFSNLTGGETVEPGWELINRRCGIGVRESVSFPTNKVNLWGTGWVVSPELFVNFAVQPGESTEWSRQYAFFGPEELKRSMKIQDRKSVV